MSSCVLEDITDSYRREDNKNVLLNLQSVGWTEKSLLNFPELMW